MGWSPVTNGEPAIGVSAPVVGLTSNAETVLKPRLLLCTNFPDGATAMCEKEVAGAETGVSMRVSAPVLALTANAETKLWLET
jgi:hypothetical protein